MNRIVKAIEQDEVIVVSALSKLLRDKTFVSLSIAMLLGYLTTRDPSLAPEEPLILILVFGAFALLLHTFTLSDVQGAPGTPIPTNLDSALIQWISDLIAALNTNTAATKANTDTTAVSTGQALIKPPPERAGGTFLVGAHAPQGDNPDPARTAPTNGAPNTVG